ncbi:protein lethal(2)denticleless [Teleopsis dalmanni]|uniref:protein lethal(2)denticleless n=1 Tax=Teleopsis dalmanni TaxID=139649 RepID=UPI0018CD2710|nr:protein lethal(2)denticleless [Teleopsis dalmanni]
MNSLQSLIKREHGMHTNVGYDFALRRLCVAREDSWLGISPSDYNSDYNPEPPIFSAKFANCDGYRHILAIANEDGKIALQDVNKRNYSAEEKSLNAPQCHYNAVFDLEWAPGQMKFVSASGDHTARLWIVTGSEIIQSSTFLGHTRSVKTAAFRKCDSSVFATGGRDGAIIIWDTRAALSVDMTPRIDNCIFSGHAGGPGTPVSRKKRHHTPKLAPNTSTSSITGLAFQNTNTLISCGAGDGVIKVWDLRRNYTSYKKEPLPRHSLPYAGTSTFRGFTNLIIDDSASRLYANCMDNTIYCYNLSAYSPQPLACYKGLQNSTFYIKSCLSPDGRYLLSGSSDEKAYIWNLEIPEQPLVALSGHTVEVTCVAWGSTNDCPIVTCSDDARHKIWRIGPENLSIEEQTTHYRGKATVLPRLPKMLSSSNLCSLQFTPRSIKHLAQSGRTPDSIEKLPNKRSFLEMLGPATGCENMEHEQKRQRTMESRARRLFSPSTSSGIMGSAQPTCHIFKHLSAIAEETPENTNPPLVNNQSSMECNQENNLETLTSASNKSSNLLISPLSERAITENRNNCFNSPPDTSSNILSNGLNGVAASSNTQQPLSSVVFSPTSNLPNYVLDGEAPHLVVMSPTRKHKDKIDWLTKIRKQKLLSSRGSTLTEKMNEQRSTEVNVNFTNIMSPRLQNLRNEEGSPRNTTPRRRSSHSGRSHETMSPSAPHPKTPTSSRRNSETSILRFFRVQHKNDTNATPTENNRINLETTSATMSMTTLTNPNTHSVSNLTVSSCTETLST